MTSATISTGRATLADRVFSRSLATDIALIAGGALLTGLAAQVAIPLQPVPITGQTLAVLLVGSTLGALRGALSMVLYAVLGIAGLPVFSDFSSGAAVVGGPTGGYILGFIASAALVGWLAERRWDRRFLPAALSFAGGTIVTFAVGMVWLQASLGLTVQETLTFGLYPFIVGGVVKALLAAGILPLLWKGIDAGGARR
jgi:biotin transport system substrate-specific component